MFCTCVFPIIPLHRDTAARPSVTCALHKTLATRWDSINDWQSFYDALKVDDPSIEPFDEWVKKVGC